MTDLTASQRDVAIALATYNGALYLTDLLDSLDRQSWQQLHVVVSDDASTDSTLALLDQHQGRLDIAVCADASKKGVVRNFETALLGSSAGYVALCDQDDVWHADKVERLMAEMLRLEQQHGQDVPLLVFCDLQLVDGALVPLSESYFAATTKSNDARTFKDFAIGNHVPGCAMLLNRKLIDLAVPFPGVSIHDWWLILVCTAFGHVGFVDERLIDYRQHGKNTIGLGIEAGGTLAKIVRTLRAPLGALAARRVRWNKSVAAIRSNMAGLQTRFADQLPAPVARIAQAILTPGNRAELLWMVTSRTTGERLLDRVAIWWLLGRAR